MKKLNVDWDGVYDSTGYLFSLAKSLSCAVKNSPWADCAEDVIATSGFAFRMWVSPDLCPSAVSIWDFEQQKPWVESSGLTCDYVGRYWDQEDIAEARRLEAVALIQGSIDRGIPAVCWDIGTPEWGLITGYDAGAQVFETLPVNGRAQPLDYAALGKRELPLLSVLTITGQSGKSQADILSDTMKLAVHHLRGGEWCGNAKGLDAYPALIRHFEADFSAERSWNMEYFLGTLGALKYYDWRYFEKAQQMELAACCKAVYEAWQEAFRIKTTKNVKRKKEREKIAALLKIAQENEQRAVEMMEKMI